MVLCQPILIAYLGLRCNSRQNTVLSVSLHTVKLRPSECKREAFFLGVV